MVSLNILHDRSWTAITYCLEMCTHFKEYGVESFVDTSDTITCHLSYFFKLRDVRATYISYEDLNYKTKSSNYIIYLIVNLNFKKQKGDIV